LTDAGKPSQNRDPDRRERHRKTITMFAGWRQSLIKGHTTNAARPVIAQRGIGPSDNR
jgi:hypothetical protein